MRDGKTHPPLASYTYRWSFARKRHNRKKMTLASAIKEAQAAGVMQGRVTVGGVSVELGSRSDEDATLNPANEWDTLQ